MLTEVDEGKGLVKVYWKDVSKRVAKVAPIFAKLVDKLSPDKSFPLYLAYYPYGALKGDTQSTFLPLIKGGYYRLTDSKAPKDILKNLSYGKKSAPLAMLLDKNLELFIDLKDERITIPRIIYQPGAFFPLARILSGKNKRVYAPNGVLTLTSGVRSTFILPNIGCAINHANLKRDFNILSSPPKGLYEHWYIFKEIINSKVINSDWRSCLLYFSKNWLDQIYFDEKWFNLKLYLHELAWQQFEFQRNNSYYDVAFSIIQKKRNLKPNPYLVDTARHLFTTALGDAPGYAPAVYNQSMPADIIQKVFIESYGLKKYFPILFQPIHFNFEKDKFPVYYSLQHPSTHVFSPKSRKESNTLIEMRELEHITRIFMEELAQKDGMCSDTVISKAAQNIEFNYFHNKFDKHNIIRPSIEILEFDQRFSEIKYPDMQFASDAPFVRGCVGIKTKFQS